MSTEIRFEPFEQIAASIRAFAGFQDDLRQTMQQSMAQLQQGLAQMAREFAAGMAEYERYANEEEAEVFKVLSQGGWLGMERHFTLSQARSVLQIYKSKGEAAILAAGARVAAAAARRIQVTA